MPRLSWCCSFGLGLYLMLGLPISRRLSAMLDRCVAGSYRPTCEVRVVKLQGAAAPRRGEPIGLLTAQQRQTIMQDAIRQRRSVGEALADATIEAAKARAAGSHGNGVRA